MSTNEIEQLREERDAFKASSDIRGAEVERLRARVAEWEQKAANWIASPEATARLDGYRELAQRLNAADARVAELEQDAKRYRWLRQRDLETIDAALAKDGA